MLTYIVFAGKQHATNPFPAAGVVATAGTRPGLTLFRMNTSEKCDCNYV